MRRVVKTLDIIEERVNYENDLAIRIEANNISHSMVHYHPDTIEFLFCLEGSVMIKCNHESVTLDAGEIYTIGSDDIHCVYSDEANFTLSIFLDLSNRDISSKELISSYFACEDLSCRDYQRRELSRVKAILLSLAYKDFFNELDISTSLKAVNTLIGILLENFNWMDFRDEYPNYNPIIHERMTYVVEYCYENYAEKLTASNLASLVHINENYFSQFFKHSSYGGFNKLVGYIRCLHAQPLILSSEMSVIEIAQSCGFSDVKYFYKHFKAWWNETPNEYRKWFADYIREDKKIEPLDHEKSKALLTEICAKYLFNVVV